MKALEDMKVPLRRWYPFGRDHLAYPVRIERETYSGREVEMIEYAVCRGAGVVAMERSTVRDFVNSARWALPKAIEKKERLAAVAVSMKYPEEIIQRAQDSLAGLIALRDQNTPLAETAFECNVSADVVVVAREGVAGDMWRYIDGLTGGCCNTQMRTVDGVEMWEGTWSAHELPDLIEKDPSLRVVAVTLRSSEECRALLGERLRKAIAGMRTMEELDEQYRAEHKTWRAPREAKLLAALQAGRLEGGGDLILEPSSMAVWHDCQKNEVRIEGRYRLPDDDMDWGMEAVGQFSPEGELISVAVSDRHRTTLVEPLRFVPAGAPAARNVAALGM